MWGIAAVGGIGFTVSLFIAQLAYDDPTVIDTAKIGVLCGSVISGALGALLLSRRARAAAESRRPARSPTARRRGRLRA